MKTYAFMTIEQEASDFQNAEGVFCRGYDEDICEEQRALRMEEEEEAVSLVNYSGGRWRELYN
jgi:hypothetical protein